jgi:LmbE family N-acetylglucosaminyl deacetylase
MIVLSPHLDDAVFSVGATIARASRGGARVSVVTVFAGDPQSSVPVGEWDRLAGFATAGEAATTRRREDRKACSLLAATPVWQPFLDEQYADDSDDDALADVLEEALRTADTVLLPGFPLTHPDHVRLVRLVLTAGLFSGRLGLYAEQPYMLWEDRAGVSESLRDLVPQTIRWRGTRIGYRDLALKIRACRAYSSQLVCIPHRIVWPMSRHEMFSGDVVAFPDSS